MRRYQKFKAWSRNHPVKFFLIAVLFVLGFLSIDGSVSLILGPLSGLFMVFTVLVIGVAAFFWLFPTASRLFAKIAHRGGQEYTIMWHFHRQDRKHRERENSKGRQP